MIGVCNVDIDVPSSTGFANVKELRDLLMQKERRIASQVLRPVLCILQDMPRPFTKLKALDLDELAKDITAAA